MQLNIILLNEFLLKRSFEQKTFNHNANMHKPYIWHLLILSLTHTYAVFLFLTFTKFLLLK